MKLPRRQFLHLAVGATVLPTVSRVARGKRTLRGPCASSSDRPRANVADITARLIGQWVSQRVSQQFIIEVRPGAGGNIATEAAAGAPPDGYTLLLVNSQNTINSVLYEKLNFNFSRDIVPIAGVDLVPLIMEVNIDFPAKTVPEFIAHAKANPGKMNMGSAGIGGPQHVAGELFKIMAGVNLVHVPNRGSTPALTDLLGGQVQVMFDVTPSSLPMLESVRRDHAGLHSFLNISLIEARRRNASAFRLRFSQSLASRRQRPSHANVRSTTHRFGSTTKPLA